MQIDQNSGTQQQQQNSQAQQNQSSQKVSEDEASRFSKQLEKKDRHKKASSGQEEEQKLENLFAERSKQAKELMEQRLKEQKDGQGGGGSREHMMDMAFAQIQDAQFKSDIQLKEIQHTKSIKEVEAALQKMADQIQVSAKDAINGAEIRISIKDNILPGTEVRIHRHGGELTVTMNTTSAETHNLLAQHEASLQKHLNDRFSNEKVNINFNMAGDNDDPGDGRSRNQYTQEDDNNNDDKKTV
ncbi:type III secretion HpaP family protein [Endozoicomonas sp. Mp262]|uniref:type III secretion HpaP family protein n=1 Tax=Endozoicomonas sp. Mp262 TaxID=2919499 RepID=UPI0021DFDEA9